MGFGEVIGLLEIVGSAVGFCEGFLLAELWLLLPLLLLLSLSLSLSLSLLLLPLLESSLAAFSSTLLLFFFGAAAWFAFLRIFLFLR